MNNKIIDYKKYFPWFKNNSSLIYLDNAATTLKPYTFIRKINELNKKFLFLNLKNSKIDKKINKLILNTTTNLAKFLQSDIDEIFYTSGATQSLNLIADFLEDKLNKNDEVILHYLEHSSNLLPWFKLRNRKKIKINFVGKSDTEINFDTFKQHINSKTKVIAFTSASNLLANLIDVKKIIIEIKKINPKIIFVIDATQQLEHFPALCHDINCDFLVGSAHKIIGPTGVGFLYIKKDVQTKILTKTNIEELKALDVDKNSIIAFNESLKLWMKIGYEKINEREKMLKKYFLDNVDLKKIKIYNPNIDSPLITFNVYDKNKRIIDAQDIEFYLGMNGILSRSSLSCAKLAHKSLNARNVVRISLFFYNDLKDIKKLVYLINNFKDGDELNGLI